MSAFTESVVEEPTLEEALRKVQEDAVIRSFRITAIRRQELPEGEGRDAPRDQGGQETMSAFTESVVEEATIDKDTRRRHPDAHGPAASDGGYVSPITLRSRRGEQRRPSDPSPHLLRGPR